MKNLMKCLLGLSVYLVSCQQDNLPMPGSGIETADNSDTNAKISSTATPKYILKVHGQNPLTYSYGRLDMLIDENTGSYNGTTRYTYKQFLNGTGMEVTTTVYEDYKMTRIKTVAKYRVDLTTGLCSESTHQAYIVPGSPNPATDPKPKTWGYIYNSYGQLTMRFNKNNLLEWFKYDYVNNDLVKATTYDANGAKVKEILFTYDQPSGQPLRLNLYPMYIEAADLPDRYLNIFGKSSLHLLTHATRKFIAFAEGTPYEHLYTYTYNADGYVTGESKFRVGQTWMFEYKSFTY